MRSVIIGATAGVGRSLAYELARSGRNLILTSSDHRDLEALANDIRLTLGRDVQTIEMQVDDNTNWISELVSKIDLTQKIDELFIPMGASTQNDDLKLASSDIKRIYEVNLVSIPQIVNSLLPSISDSGVIVGFGSIASARGRGKNIHYSSAKAGLKTYFESLSHALAPTSKRVHWYQLGYVDTQQSAGQKLLFPVATPDAVAKKVVGNLQKGNKSTVYPFFWRFILVVLRSLPWPIFKKLQF